MAKSAPSRSRFGFWSPPNPQVYGWRCTRRYVAASSTRRSAPCISTPLVEPSERRTAMDDHPGHATIPERLRAVCTNAGFQNTGESLWRSKRPDTTPY